MAHMSMYEQNGGDNLFAGLLFGGIIAQLVVNDETIDTQETNDKIVRQKIDDKLIDIFDKRGLNPPGYIAWVAAVPESGERTYFEYPGGSYDPGEMPLNNAGSFLIQASDFSWSISIQGFDLSFTQINSLIAKGRFFNAILAGADEIDLTAGDDVLSSYGGDDDIQDLGGSNTFHGGGGNDEISMLTLFDTKPGSNRLYGDSGNDSITGCDGADYIDGGKGIDTLTGGLGNDTYIVDNTNDIVKEYSQDGGKDTVYSSVSYQLTIYCDTLILTGDGNNKAHGSVIGDKIIGNKGDNLIDGGAGGDLLKGGAGADSFVFDDGDAAKTKSVADTVLDFKPSQKDIIDLSDIDAIAKTTKDDDFDFIGKAGFTHAGQLRYVRDTHDTWIYGETTDDGKVDFAIHLDGAVDLKSGSFDL